MAPSPIRFVADSDCERIRDGWITQPVNTATSLAFVAAGAWVALRAVAADGGDEAFGLVAALALVIEGVGSVLYHGPGGRVAKLVHDRGIVLLAGALMAVYLAGLTVHAAEATGGLVLLAAGIVVHHRSRTGRPWCRPDSVLQGHGLWHLMAAVALALLADAALSST